MGKDLSIDLGGLRLKNPVITASGTAGYGGEIGEYIDLNRLGALVVKGISLKPMAGNPPPRICETPCGMLNSIGLENPGLKGFLRDYLPSLKTLKTKIIVNVLGNTTNEYIEICEALNDSGVHAIELNVSCPNVKRGGISFGTDPSSLRELVNEIKKRIKTPLITKLSPNVDDIKVFARIAEDSGSDMISLINTVRGMSIDIRTRRPRLATVTGGLSGPAIKPIAIRMVWECFNAVKIPIIGMGGIMNTDDAIEFMLAGASAVAVGTGNFVNPGLTMDIIDGLRQYMSEHRIDRIRNIVGAIQC